MICSFTMQNFLNIAENRVKFLLGKLAELTNKFHCNSQSEALMNRLPVVMTPIG